MQQPEMVTICKKEYMDLQDKKCANMITSNNKRVNGSVITNKWSKCAQIIHNFIMEILSKFKKDKRKLPHIKGLTN